MKNIKRGLVGVMIATAALTSCKKLDLYPYNVIELSQGFKTVKDAGAWNNGLYSGFRGTVNGTWAYIQDVQADQLNASLDYGNRSGAPHRWGDSFLAGETSTFYQTLYSRLANVNTIIKGYESIVPANATETASMNRYKGDAYFARAYYYHQLVLRYAKAYSPTTAASDLGVPLVLEFDVTAQPARATLKACYDQILADINTAKGLLAPVPGVQGSNKFTIDAAVALEARVKFYMQDWTGAAAAANSLISAGKYPLYTTAANNKSYWHADGKQEDILQLFVSTAEGANTQGGIYLGLNGPAAVWTPDWIPTQTVVDSYDNADFRKTIVFEQKLVQIQGLKYPNIWLVNKFPGNPALLTSTYTNYQHAPKVLRIAEQYLIAAEAAAAGGNSAGALAALNPLRIARGLPALDASVTGTALTQEVRNERTRELAFEGFRLWDLKRWGLGFNRGVIQNAGTVNTGANFNLLVIPASDPKFTWAIPPNDVNINPNIVQNPGW